MPQNATDVTVNKSGEVYATIDGQVALPSLGQLQLATFTNEAGLQAVGNNLLVETDAAGSPVTGNPMGTGFGSLVQEALEASNVDVVEQITGLITAQRAYEMHSRVIKTADDMLATISQLK